MFEIVIRLATPECQKGGLVVELSYLCLSYGISISLHCAKDLQGEYSSFLGTELCNSEPKVPPMNPEYSEEHTINPEKHEKPKA